MRFRRKKSDDAGAEGTVAAVADPATPAAPPNADQPINMQPPQQSGDPQQQPVCPPPPSGANQGPFAQPADSAAPLTGATDPAGGAAAFDMRTVGIAPAPDTDGWMGEPVDTGTPAVAAPAPQAEPVHKKGHQQPPVAADITSVGVAILPGVPLPSWVTPTPTPVAQYADQPAPEPTGSPAVQAMPAPLIDQQQSAGSVNPGGPVGPAPVAAVAPVTPVAVAAAAVAPTPDAEAAPIAGQAGVLPPPDPTQWSEHPMGRVVWGPVPPLGGVEQSPTSPGQPEPAVGNPSDPPLAPPVAATPQPVPPEAPVQELDNPSVKAQDAAPNPQVPAADQGPATPLVAAAAATTVGSAWFRDADNPSPDVAPASAPPAETSRQSNVEEYGWLLQPDTPEGESDEMASPTRATRPAYLSAPPPTGRSYDFEPPPGRGVNSAPTTVGSATSSAPVTPWFDPAEEEQQGSPASAGGWAAPAVATAAAAATALPVVAPPPTTDPVMPPPPMPVPVGPTDSVDPGVQPSAVADPQTDPHHGETPAPSEDAPTDQKPKRKALTWILIIGAALVAVAAAAYAAFVTPGFLSSTSTPDTPPAVATPATAGGLLKAAKAAEPAAGTFKKMAAATSASTGSQTATYANESVTATTWIAPVFGGSPDSIAKAYTAAGGANMGELATVPAGPRGGSMSCAAVSPKEALCFWTSEGIRGAADITGLGRSAAGELAGKMRIALEPQQP